MAARTAQTSSHPWPQIHLVRRLASSRAEKFDSQSIEVPLDHSPRLGRSIMRRRRGSDRLRNHHKRSRRFGGGSLNENGSARSRALSLAILEVVSGGWTILNPCGGVSVGLMLSSLGGSFGLAMGRACFLAKLSHCFFSSLSCSRIARSYWYRSSQPSPPPYGW